MDGLTEGRIVHFVHPTGDHSPAIVVKVHNKKTGLVNLQVFLDSALSRTWWTGVPYSENTNKKMMWHWIEKA